MFGSGCGAVFVVCFWLGMLVVVWCLLVAVLVVNSVVPSLFCYF